MSLSADQLSMRILFQSAHEIMPQRRPSITLASLSVPVVSSIFVVRKYCQDVDKGPDKKHTSTVPIDGCACMFKE